MEKLTIGDVLPLAGYLADRDRIRASAVAARAVRRVRVGDRVSLAFENRETVLFQVQEMMRVEGLSDTARVGQEVDIYNDLIAGTDELRATFFVEITDRERIAADLDSLIGLEREGLWLAVDSTRIAAEFEPGHAREDRISAVHFVSFALGEAPAEALRSRRSVVELIIDHPGYRATARLSEETVAALALDLTR